WGHVLLALLLMLPSYSRALPADSQLNFLLLEVLLDQAVLSDAIPAYDTDEHTLLPLANSHVYSLSQSRLSRGRHCHRLHPKQGSRIQSEFTGGTRDSRRRHRSVR